MSVKYHDQTIAGRTIAYLPDADVYSQEEQVVGRWIDGKPIYRRVFVATVPEVTTDKAVATTFLEVGSEVDTPVSIVGVVPPTVSDTNAYILPYASNDMAFFMKAAFYVVSPDRVSLLSNNTAWSGRPAILIAQYTKTSDTATVAIATAEDLNNAYEEGVQNA